MITAVLCCQTPDLRILGQVRLDPWMISAWYKGAQRDTGREHKNGSCRFCRTQNRATEKKVVSNEQ
jgi:hypothetical protein